MKLSKVLNSKSVKMEIKANQKKDIIEELIRFLAKNSKIDNVEQAIQDVMDRENQMSTGIQYGVAIPHGKSNEVKDLVACIGIKKEGVDFNSLDDKPSNIFILTISPKDRLGPHMQFLAEISNILKSKKARQDILNSESPEEVLKIFKI